MGKESKSPSPADVREPASPAHAPAIPSNGASERERENGNAGHYAENNLQLQNAYLQPLFESSPEAVVLLDNDFHVVRANREFLRLFGYTPEETIGRTLSELIVPPDRQRDEALRERGRQGETISEDSLRRR